ncbi:MAG TPA: 2-succinyl-5-enolpyruvyl-6-hydroxy-3-cyclohexene-1-carboxylic-acid synthase [Acidimicrobiales bacterium]|nr:2-succinyl-5-enolpyruvyl-6-hydroxy-3-cyclohexene-1-carboxylic-acid synthase [Acidimicrobiales bacterium]
MSVEADVQATFCATLVDEWLRAGITDAVVCPGSRSTPLALALAARGELRLHVRLDERGAGFFAVGLGLATGRPAVVLTTSGTAAAELHPAVVEAHHARVPLLACTADRPPELQGVGAPQTIEQVGLFGPAVRWAAAPGVPVAATRGTWRSLAARSVGEAVAGPSGPGPVHLNLAFREPLVGPAGPLPGHRPGGGPVHRVSGPSAAGMPVDGSLVGHWPGRRGLVVAGAGCGPPAQVLALAEQLGWPVLADPRSGCRLDHPNVVAAADAFLRSEPVREALRPEVVLVLGGPWASKVLAGFLAEAAGRGAEVVAVDPWWRWTDPDRLVDLVVRADPDGWLAGVLAELADRPAVAEAPPGWLDRWRGAESAAQAAIDRVLTEDAEGRRGGLTEPGVARLLLGTVPVGTLVVVSSSMPVRDLEWYARPLGEPPVVLANRGANGIDGVSATAQGVAAAGEGPVVGVLGDLAFLHDASSLVQAVPAGAPAATGCTLLVLDNGGGGIFNFLPQATALADDRFEQLFGTPQAPDPAAVARGFGLPVTEVSTGAALVQALGALVGHPGLTVIRARLPGRVENVALHDRLHQAVSSDTEKLLFRA